MGRSRTSKRCSTNTTPPPAWTAAASPISASASSISPATPASTATSASSDDETRGAAADRQLPLRSQGSPDPRRPAYLRPVARPAASSAISIVALARVPRGDGAGDASLIRALADDLKLGFDPLTAKLGDPAVRADSSPAKRGSGDRANAGGGGGRHARSATSSNTSKLLAADLVDGTRAPDPSWTATARRPRHHRNHHPPAPRRLRPRPRSQALLDGLDGKFVAPGPSGAPSRGRLDVLPTGRNFYSVDNRAVPTPTAWELGQKSAENLLFRHFQDHGIAAPLARALGLGHRQHAHRRRRHRPGAGADRRQAAMGSRPRSASPATRSSRWPNSAARASM